MRVEVVTELERGHPTSIINDGNSSKIVSELDTNVLGIRIEGVANKFLERFSERLIDPGQFS